MLGVQTTKTSVTHGVAGIRRTVTIVLVQLKWFEDFTKMLESHIRIEPYK